MLIRPYCGYYLLTINYKVVFIHVSSHVVGPRLWYRLNYLVMRWVDFDDTLTFPWSLVFSETSQQLGWIH